MRSWILDFFVEWQFSIISSLVVLVVTLVTARIVIRRLRTVLQKGTIAPETHILILVSMRVLLYGTGLFIILALFELTDTALWRVIIQPIINATITALIGLIIIKVVMKILARVLTHSRLDSTMHPFLLTVTHIGLYVLLVLIVLPKLGINIAPILTALGAVGLAVSLAVKDSLSNLMGGALILISHPFGAGDFVEIGSLSGTVTQVGPIYTFLNTVDNKRICIPNGQVSTSQVVNYSAEPLRRLDITFSIGYENDFEQAKGIIRQLVEAHPKALEDPAPVIRMSQHGANSIDLVCRVWVDNSEYWNLKFDLLEQVKVAFDREGINIPYPQMDVHLKQN